MEPSDERIKDSLNIAKEKGINIEFIETDLCYEHPTVKIIFHYEDKEDFF